MLHRRLKPLVAFALLALLGLPQLRAEPPATAVAPAPGQIQLLKGYTHRPLQGIDSIVGEIVREDGFKITYEQGAIPDPKSLFRTGGSFTNAAEGTPADQREWFREQVVSGVPMQVVMRKDHSLIVTFPKSGINFHTKVEKTDDLADVLLMLMTYPQPVVAKP